MKKKINNNIPEKKKSAKLEWFKAFLIAFILIFLIRIFAFQSYVVSDSKMEGTLFAGDYIVVNKLGFGSRIVVPFINDTVNADFKYFRFPGFSGISRNDLIFFNYPFDKGVCINNKNTCFKRCVALPGDTLNIVDKKVFINGSCFDIENNNKYRYRISSVAKLNKKNFNKYQINEGGAIDSSNVYDFFITKQIANELTKDSLVKNINLIKLRRGAESTLFFPQSENYNWNLDYFGPVVVPAKDSSFIIDYKNIDIYKVIIVDYENNKLEIKAQKVYINNIETTKYTFKMNYYFMLDDNRDNGKDSRYWGFVPENHIIGKANFVLFSIGNNNKQKSFIWNRIFKML
ncbi:MAG: signal peptidase I [Bacteroidetes bacterium GWA2_32_17]|nr:MAG: signal peptidase I [Bacteroidetes bacterium GWA2_32_17]